MGIIGKMNIAIVIFFISALSLVPDRQPPFMTICHMKPDGTQRSGQETRLVCAVTVTDQKRPDYLETIAKMKLSCSAYQAGSSYAQKILTGHTQNYGATSSTTNTSGESTHGLKMPIWQVEEIEGKGSPNDNSDSPVEGTSSRHGGHGGGGGGGSSRDPEGGTSSRRTSGSSGAQERHSDSTSKTHDSSRSPSESPAHRTKSNQRWMKLRTTVQLSGAISSTIQKKTPLKREDSFLKRFSTRQIPEAQFNGSQTEDLQGTRFCLETFEVGEDDGLGGLGGGQKVRRKKKPSLPRSVVNPDGNFYFYWLMILTACVLYNLWTLIVRESFPELQADGQLVYWILADAFCDLIFLLDIAVQFRTGYLEQGLMVYKTKKLAKHYMNSRPFCLDLVSLTPTDLAQFYFGIHPMFRVPRFMKIYRIYKYYYMVESRTVYPNIWRVVNLIHILLLLAHWFACFYYLLSEAEGFEGHWVYPNPEIHSAFNSVTRKYLGSLYWSTLTLTTIGDLPTPYSNWQLGNRQSLFNPKANVIFRNHTHSRLHYLKSNNAYLFTIVSYLIGVFTFATIVGQVGNVITNRNANRLEFERLLDGAKMYMRHHKVPRDMQRRVLRWYDYSWSRGRIQGGGDINTALGLLPDKLKTELALHVNLSVLKKVTIFQECQPEFLHDLVLKMKAYIFTPGDLICRKGEVAREMFIIADGILEVISEAGRVLTTMQAGDFFGEIGILNLDGLNKRTADVRSVGYSELFSLSREDVLAAMKDYPEAQEILQTLGRKRLMEARKAAGPPALKKHASEKKSSPLHLLGHSIRKGSDDSPGGEKAGKRIVEKLRSDVKGLRNAIRKSRKSNSSKEDSSEQESSSKDVASTRKQSSVSMHPYYFSSVGMDGRAASIAGGVLPTRSIGGAVSRGVLKRMHHVVLSDEKEKGSGAGSPPPGSSMATLSPLKMPKRVQVQTPAQEIVYPAQGPSSASGSGGSIGSGSGFALMKQRSRTGAMSSPPPAPVPGTEEREVIGAGLPLIYRLRLLKQKEEREAAAALATAEETKRLLRPTKEDDETQQHTYTKVTVETQRDAPPSTANTFSEPLFPGGSARIPLPMTPPSPALLLGSHTIRHSHSLASEPSNESVSPLPIANIDEEIEPRTSSFSEKKRPLALGLQKNTKTYGSIDDLSPEFSRLPFIKKLKILNERQKIAELLTTQSGAAVLTRSTSEGSSGIPHTVSPDGESEMMHSLLHGRRTQSSSDGRRQLVQTQPKPDITKFLPRLSSSSSSSPESDTKAGGGGGERKSGESDDRQPSASTSAQISSSSMDSTVTVIERGGKSPLSETSMSPPYSPESNETPERRRLKSILKQLQSEVAAEGSYSADVEDTQESGSKDDYSKPNAAEKSQSQVLSQEERELLKAPTFEGFAARHRKFAKNVTFHRQAVCSPEEEHAQQFQLGQDRAEGTTGEEGQHIHALTPLASEALKHKLSRLIFMTGDNNSGEGNKAGLESLGLNLGLGVAQEECISGIFFGIKAIIQGKLEEMQCRFQDRFVILETEVRRRDEIIALLQHRIQELEEKSMLGYGKGDKYFPYSNGGQGGDGNLEAHHRLGAGGYVNADDDDDEEIVHLSREQQPSNYLLHHQSSYLFSRGDSIDTVISNQDFDDDVFLMCDEEGAATVQSSGQYRRLYSGGPHHSASAVESIEMTEVHHASSPAEEIPMWQLEFHRDSMSMTATTTAVTTKVPPSSPVDVVAGRGQSDSVAVEIGNTSTEYEESSDTDSEDGRKPSRVLKEHKISLEEDSSSDDDAKSTRGGGKKRGSAAGAKEEEEEEESEEEDSSDEELEGLDNKNWEVQLLIKEMEKQEAKKQQSVIMEEEEDASNIGEMRMLEDEMREMREAVSSGALSPTELDMLDDVIQMRSERVKELWKAYSTESEGGCRHATAFSPKSKKVGRSVEDFRAGDGSSSLALRRGNSVRRPLKRSEEEMTASKSGGARSSKMIRRQASLCEPAKAIDPSSTASTFIDVHARRRESADSLAKFPADSARSIFSKFRLMRTLSKTFHLSPSSESFEGAGKSQHQLQAHEAEVATSSSTPATTAAASSSSGFLPMISSAFSSALHSKTTTATTLIPMTSTAPRIFTIPSTSAEPTTSSTSTTELTSPPATGSSRTKSLGESQPLLKK